MPPRSAKKVAGGPSAGRKTPAKAVKGASGSQAQPQEPTAAATSPPPAKVEEVVVEEKMVEVVEAKLEVKTESTIKEVSNPSPAAEGSTKNASAEVKDVKGSLEEDKAECLDLDDNEVEYEEEHTLDDEAEYEDDEQEELLEVEVEDEEADEVGDEETEVVYEEFDDGAEDGGGGEDVEHLEDLEVVEEHHEVTKERRKRKEYEVFVGGLDNDATEADLREVFSTVGEVTEVRLLMNPVTKKNKGFAFLRYATAEQAKRAVSELKNTIINGKQCGVTPSKDSDTLFLGNICKSWTKDDLKDKLKSYGITNVEEFTLVEDNNKEGCNRGFAFLEFSSRDDAMAAFRRLQKRDVVFGTERTARVSFADSFVEPDDEIMAQVKTVFVDGLHPSWDEDRVKTYLKKFGVIEKVELARNMPVAKRKDFGFVSFDTNDAALKCIEGINNQELGEGSSKVKVRARLSRPLQRSRGKSVSRGDFRVNGGAPRGGSRSLLARPSARRLPVRAPRDFGIRGARIADHRPKRPMGYLGRRPAEAISERTRRFPPAERFYEKRPPVPAYMRGSLKAEYSRHDEIPPRSRPTEYGPRAMAERRASFRDDYIVHGSGYADIAPRGGARVSDRRPYADETYERKFDRPLPTYREGHSRDYDSISGAKRSFSAIDDAPRYADMGTRHSRARLDYGASAQYDDAYAERPGRSHVGYSARRSSISDQDSRALYDSRQGMSYGRSGNDAGGMYSSSFSSSYLPRGSDGGGSSYSSYYSNRDGGYLGGGSSSYY